MRNAQLDPMFLGDAVTGGRFTPPTSVARSAPPRQDGALDTERSPPAVPAERSRRTRLSHPEQNGHSLFFQRRLS